MIVPRAELLDMKYMRGYVEEFAPANHAEL